MDQKNKFQDIALERINDVLKDVSSQISRISKKFEEESTNRFGSNDFISSKYPGVNSRLSARLYSTIIDLTRPGSAYRTLIKGFSITEDWSYVYSLWGILDSLKKDYEKGYLADMAQLINADTFSDILEQSEYLLSEGYDRASSVVAGVALEEHLRKLSEANHIETNNEGKYIKAEALNSQLAKNGVYPKTIQKGVTQWLGIRNDGAHPEIEAADAKTIELMIMGIRNFIDNYPA